MNLVIDLPRKASDTLFPSHTTAGIRVRYRVLWGGRDGAKSHSIARILLARGMAKRERILCVREIQKSLADSSHKLLSDLITTMGLAHFYTVQKTTIVGANGTEFLFHGLSTETRDSLKSKEGTTLCWVEEAQTITKRSWDILEPTIRADESEIIISFNPHLDTDETYARFVSNPPADAIVTHINWSDNPWRSKVLDVAREKMRVEAPDDYANIYGGECRPAVEGAIYAAEAGKMTREQRIRNVPRDPMLSVHTVWDLGWNDQTSIIFVQRNRNEVSIFDYWESSQVSLPDWVARLKALGYNWGHDWLPHDAAAHSKQTGKTDAELMKGLGRSVSIVQNIGVEQGIQAVRAMMPRVYIDKTRCARLLECLRRYRRNIPDNTGDPATPLHDEFSHGADAFRYLGVIVDRITNQESLAPIKYPRTGVA